MVVKRVHLSGLDDVVQGFHGFLDGNGRVPAMDLVQVDILGAEPGQAGIDLGEDLLAREAAAIGPTTHPPVQLGGQHDLVAVGEVFEGPASDLLT
jgi:hypothetical protein